MVGRFLERMDVLADRRVILHHRTDAARYRVVRPSDDSRYFPRGRRRIQARLRRRLGRWYNCPGILLTLTFDPKRISQPQAWRRVGQLRRQFLNRLNLWRRRHGYERRSLACVSVLENMTGTGYPHVHVVFPQLRYLAPCEVVTDLWGWGITDVRYCGAMSPVAYICKYVSKLDGWDDLQLAYLQMYHTRLYSVSQRYLLPDDGGRAGPPEWSFLLSTTALASGAVVDILTSAWTTTCCVPP